MENIRKRRLAETNLVWDLPEFLIHIAITWSKDFVFPHMHARLSRASSELTLAPRVLPGVFALTLAVLQRPLTLSDWRGEIDNTWPLTSPRCVQGQGGSPWQEQKSLEPTEGMTSH